MRSGALAIGWAFRRRHRWGLTAVAGYLLVAALIRLLFRDLGPRVTEEDAWAFAIVVMVPLTATFVYLLAVFSFGLAGDLAGRQSMYPARMFTLPMTNGALALWPMLYGTAAMAILWLVTRSVAVWPSDFRAPLLWPGLAAAALLAWTQALTWMPYGLPGLRVLAAVLCLGAFDVVVMLGLHFRATEPVMLAILAPQILLAYLVARSAVARARRGDVPDWRRRAGPRPVMAAAPGGRGHFASPARAKLWFEWRRHGLTLPAWVALLLPVELSLLFAAGNEAPVLVFLILLGVLLTPPCMASVAGATLRTSAPSAPGSWGLSPFDATKPMSGPALIAARLTMALWSTLAAWLVVLVAIPLALTLSGTWPVVSERIGRFAGAVGTPRAVVAALFLLSGLVASTWKQLVQSLYVGLTGRPWVIRANALLALTFLVLIGPVAEWMHDDPDVAAALWSALPAILAGLVLVKMSAAAWVAKQLVAGRLLGDRALVTGAVGWSAAVFALYGVFVWFWSTPLVPRHVLALVAILAVPLARLSAAPLALEWNRHR